MIFKNIYINVLYTVPMNINAYVSFLMNTLDTVVWWVMY